MVFVDLLAGTFAGFGICAVGHPFDTIKVLLQTQPGRYSGMMDAVKQTVKSNGPLGLYKGVASPLVGMSIFNAVQFTVFSAAKDYFTNKGENSTLTRIAVAAGVTGVVVSFVEGPQDLFKCQMQNQLAAAESGKGAVKYNGIMDCAKDILKTNGLRGPFQGITATICRNFLGVSAYFFVYEATKMYMAGDKPVSSLSPMKVMLAGGIGGIGYWILSYPFDVIKSAMQCDAVNKNERAYKNTVHCAKTLWAQGGMARYTAGLSPCLARAFPANAVGFLLYEMVKNSFQPKTTEALVM